MKWYVLRRVAWAVLAAYIAVSLTFGLLMLTPNAGADVAAAQAATSGQDAEAVREAYLERRGLDRPITEQYVDYMINVFTFDWGYSFSQGEPVLEAIGESWLFSAQYFVPSVLISAFVGYSVGLYSALNRYTTTDYLGSFVAYFGISIPNFWFAIVLLLLFGVVLGFVPTYYDTGVPLLSFGNLRQLVLPIVVLSTASVAGQMRYSRAQAIEYAEADFVKTARAKGASEWRVLTRHILRVALVPLSTILIVDVLAVLFAGSFIIETIFQIPGLGRLTLEAINQQDTPLVLATTLIPVFIAIIGNLLQDLAYVVLDPRIDYGDR
jgi:peptide/nickel transport system permease protein